MGQYLMDYYPSSVSFEEIENMRNSLDNEGFYWHFLADINFEREHDRKYLHRAVELGSWFAIHDGWLNSPLIREQSEESWSKFYECIDNRTPHELFMHMAEVNEEPFGIVQISLETYEMKEITREDVDIVADGFYYYLH